MKIYEPLVGENVCKTAKHIVALANKTKGSVTARFNDITLTANLGDNPESIERYYDIEWNRRREEYVKSPKYKRRQRKAEEVQRRQNLILKRALLVAPKKMTLRDEEGWKKAIRVNTDVFGNCVMSFAERWARLMEDRIANGDTLEACAEMTSSLADNECITGFMYGYAVSILSQVWIHGDQLRCWHNIKTQIEDEGEKANANGGVLNPALLNIG